MLWFTSLAMTGAALAIMVGLLLARWGTRWRARARAEERRRLVPLLLGDGEEEIRPLLWLADKFIAELMVELMQLVRGRERERFTARAEALGVPERLRGQLGSGSSRVRQTAAEALAYFEDERTTEGLRHALGDSNPDVRLTAALALAQSGRAPPLRELVYRLDIGRSEKSLLVNALFKELARHGTAELEALLRSPDAPLTARIAAADALAEAGDYGSVSAIAEAALGASENGPELPRMLRALARLGHPAAAPAVARALASAAPSARAAAAEAAGRIGFANMADRLAELLGDPSWRVRFRSAQALVALGDEGLARLRSAAAGGGPPASEAATRILGEKGLA